MNSVRRRAFFGLLLAAFCILQPAWADPEQNKRLARGFYENLWFNENTDRYGDYVADEYVVHDIGDDKNLTDWTSKIRRTPKIRLTPGALIPTLRPRLQDSVSVNASARTEQSRRGRLTPRTGPRRCPFRTRLGSAPARHFY
ncbi:MAG: hypothetical protein RQ847_02455 [Wenzhouxiangellaceae bacterium]|nr:hypothetical protein [Wenzhouxiangellaceae bacterium]